MTINATPRAPQNGDSNAVNPTLTPEMLPVKEEKGKEENSEVVVLGHEEGEEGEEEDDEEAMFQWALSTLRRTQYLSDSDSEDENKSQPKTSGEQVSQALASQASLRWVDSNQREVLSGSVDTSPAFQEDRGDFPLHYSPLTLGEPEEDPLALPVQTERGLLPSQENTQTADADIPNQTAGCQEPSVREGVPCHEIKISKQNLRRSSEDCALPRTLEEHTPLVVDSREAVNVKVEEHSHAQIVGRGLTHSSAINTSTHKFTSKNATGLPRGHVIDQLVAKLKRRLASPSLPSFSDESDNTASSHSKEDIVQRCKYLSQENSNLQLPTHFKKGERVQGEVGSTAVGSVCSVSSEVTREKADVTEPANHPHGAHPLEGFNAAAEPNIAHMISVAPPEGSYRFTAQTENQGLDSSVKLKGAEADNQHTLSNVTARRDLNITVQRYVTDSNREATATSNMENTQTLAGVHPDSSVNILEQGNHLQNTSKAKAFNLSSTAVASILRENPTIRKLELAPSDSSVVATKPSHNPLVIFNRRTPCIILKDCTKTPLPHSEFSDSNGERKHILLHFYTCNICGRVYRCRSSVKRHKKTHHQVTIGDSSQDDSGENDDRRDSDYDPGDDNERVGVPYSLREHAPKIHNFITAESDEDERWQNGNSNMCDNRRRRKRKKQFLQRFGLQKRRRKSAKYDFQVKLLQNNANVSGACYTEENIPDYVQFFQCYLCEEKLDSEILLRSHVYRCTEAFLENSGTLAEHDNKSEPMSISPPTDPVPAHAKGTSLDLPLDRISTTAPRIPPTRAGDVLKMYPSATGRDVHKTACSKNSSNSMTEVTTDTTGMLLSADSCPASAPSNYTSPTEPVNSSEGARCSEGMLNSGNECPSVFPCVPSVSQGISLRNEHTNRSPNQFLNDAQSSVAANCIESPPSTSSSSCPSVTQDSLKKDSENNSLLLPANPSCNNRPATEITFRGGNDKLSKVSNVVQFNRSRTGAPRSISVTEEPCILSTYSAASEAMTVDISTPLVPINHPVTKGSSDIETVFKTFDHAPSKSRKPISKRRHSDTVLITSGTLQYNNTDLIQIRNRAARDDTANAVSGTLQSDIFSSEEPLPKRHHGDDVATTSSAMQPKSTSRIPTIASVPEIDDKVSASFMTLDTAPSDLSKTMDKHPVGDIVRPKSAPLQDVSTAKGPIRANCTSRTDAVTTTFSILQNAMSNLEDQMAKHPSCEIVSASPGDLQPISNPRVPLTSDVNSHNDTVSLESRTSQTTGSESQEPAANVPNTIHELKISITDINSKQSGSLHPLANIVFPVNINAADTVMAGSLSVRPPIFTCFGQPSNLPRGILITNAAGAAAERIIVVPALCSGGPANPAETSPVGVTVSLPRASGVISFAQGSLFPQGTNINPLITSSNIPSGLTSSGSSSISQQVYGESTGKNVKKVSGSPFTISRNGSLINAPGTVVISKRAVGEQSNSSEVKTGAQSSIASCSSSAAANIRTEPSLTASKYRKILPKS